MVKIRELKSGKIVAMQDRYAKTLVKLGKHAYVGDEGLEQKAALPIADSKKKEHFSVQPEMVGAEAKVMTPESKVEHSVGAMITNRALVAGTDEQPRDPRNEGPQEQQRDAEPPVGDAEEETSPRTGRKKRSYNRRDLTAED